MHEVNPGVVLDELYEIVGPIGHGGMAVVYAARPLNGAPEVAVKVLAIQSEAEDEIKRQFFRELLLATRVRHPNIVRVLDFGVVPGSGAPYLVMERLHGSTLHREIRRNGPLTRERALRLFVGALDALAEAHALGVVHRDLKPSNLFLSREEEDGDERLVILDFGIAHRVAGAEPSQGAGTAATPRYAAPEYILRHEITPGIDVYQMGLILAEALSGRPVVSAWEAEECLRAHVNGPLELPMEVLGNDLGPTLRRATHPDPAARFKHAGELRQALEVASRFSGGPDWDDDAQATEPSVESQAPATDHRILVPALVQWERPRFPTLPLLGMALAVFLSAFTGGLLVAWGIEALLLQSQTGSEAGPRWFYSAP